MSDQIRSDQIFYLPEVSVCVSAVKSDNWQLIASRHARIILAFCTEKQHGQPLTGVDVTNVRVAVTGAPHTACVSSAAWRVAMITVVTRLAELPDVTVRAPALLHVHGQFTHVRVYCVVLYGSCKNHVVDETET